MSIAQRVAKTGRVVARAHKLARLNPTLTVGEAVTNAESELRLKLEEEEHGLACMALFALCSARPRPRGKT